MLRQVNGSCSTIPHRPRKGCVILSLERVLACDLEPTDDRGILGILLVVGRASEHEEKCMKSGKNAQEQQILLDIYL
jgi:hypothetical protein